MAWGIACTLAARSGPAGFPRGDWQSRSVQSGVEIGVRLEWRFLSLKRLVPSVRGLAAAGPAGGDTAWDVAYTHAVHSGPAGSPPGD